VVRERTQQQAVQQLALVCLAQFMVVLDVSIVNVALPSIRDDLHFSQAGLQWVVNGYTLAFAGFLLLGGRAADLYGRRRVFLLGMGLFTAASLAGGLAQRQGMLIAARTAQGLGGAILSPATLTILTTAFTDGRSRSRALGMWSAVAGAGGAAGSLLGGLLTDVAGWDGHGDRLAAVAVPHHRRGDLPRDAARARPARPARPRPGVHPDRLRGHRWRARPPGWPGVGAGEHHPAGRGSTGLATLATLATNRTASLLPAATPAAALTSGYARAFMASAAILLLGAAAALLLPSAAASRPQPAAIAVEPAASVPGPAGRAHGPAASVPAAAAPAAEPRAERAGGRSSGHCSGAGGPGTTRSEV
jgi:hypothetical protein